MISALAAYLAELERGMKGVPARRRRLILREIEANLLDEAEARGLAGDRDFRDLLAEKEAPEVLAAQFNQTDGEEASHRGGSALLAGALIGLATGSIWARIIWGIWWTWDPRLTWALITCVLYAAYLMMRNMIDDASARARFASVLGTFAFASVAITYKAIDWWRTQHPGPVLPIRTGGDGKWIRRCGTRSFGTGRR